MSVVLILPFFTMLAYWHSLLSIFVVISPNIALPGFAYGHQSNESIEYLASSEVFALAGAIRRRVRQEPPPRISGNVVNATTSTGEVKTLAWRTVEHRDGKLVLKSYLVYDPTIASPQTPRPAVLVVHDWDGMDEFEKTKAEALARLGYVGYAVDMFGRTGGRPWVNDGLVDSFRKNRPLFLKRLQLAKDEVSKMPFVDKERLGAVGFSFGALGALDMARAGWNLSGVVSFHGTLGAPASSTQHPENANITAKILVLHGYGDLGVPPTAVRAFEQEMAKRKADWQVYYYANATDFFTKPSANVPGRAMYDAIIDKRSWRAMKDFFEEVFE